MPSRILSLSLPSRSFEFCRRCNAVSPCIFRLVKRTVRPVQEIFRRITRPDNTTTPMETVNTPRFLAFATAFIGVSEKYAPYIFRDRKCATQEGLGKNHHKLLSTKTTHDILSFDVLLDHFCHEPQYVISDQMAVFVVKVLEMVYVYKKYGQAAG